jgi:hypothetical protein
MFVMLFEVYLRCLLKLCCFHASNLFLNIKTIILDLKIHDFETKTP